MSNEFVIWGQPVCPHCGTAKRLLQELKYTYEYKEIGVTHTKEEFFAEVPGARSVPQILYRGVVIGDLASLRKLLDNA